MPSVYEPAIEKLMYAIFDDRCPGIAFHEADRPYYRSAAIAALTALGAIPANEIDALTVAIDDLAPAAVDG